MQARMLRAGKRPSTAGPARGRTTLRAVAASRAVSPKKGASSQALSSLPGVGPKLEGLLKGQGCATIDDLVRLHHEQNQGNAEATKAWLMVRRADSGWVAPQPMGQQHPATCYSNSVPTFSRICAHVHRHWMAEAHLSPTRHDSRARPTSRMRF